MFMQSGDGKWELDIMDGWPSSIQLNVYDYDDYFYGNTDGDGVLDRLPPNSLAVNFVNMSAPPKPHLSWTLIVDDSTMTWSLQPRGYLSVSTILYGLLFIPFLTALIAAYIFMRSHYGIKYNQFGVISKGYQSLGKEDDGDRSFVEKLGFSGHKQTAIIGWPEDKKKRRKVLIATLEYEIIDWKLKVKIGGLGVMSSLMGKSMTDVDLIWVVPKVKDLEYPPGEPIEPIKVIIFGEPYLIEVEKHVLDNITYVILDSPVFRAQTKADPYPCSHGRLVFSDLLLDLEPVHCHDDQTQPGYRHIPSTITTVPLLLSIYSPRSCHLLVPSQCRVPGSVAASYEGGNEGSLLCVQHYQGELHEIRPIWKHLQLAPCRRLVYFGTSEFHWCRWCVGQVW
jgi:hypothetical protein